MLDIKDVLVSSGWYENRASEKLEYVINLPETRYFYNEEDGNLTVSRKKRFANAKFWGGTEVIKTGDGIVIGDFLAQSGLLNEREYAQKKEVYLAEIQREENNKKREDRTKLMSSVKEGVSSFGKRIYKVTKKTTAFSVAAIGLYFSYQYTANHVSPGMLYSYVKNNIDKYELKDIMSNDAIGGLTYSQMKNIDYAIENNQVEELLEMVQDTPENINYITVLKENTSSTQN